MEGGKEAAAATVQHTALMAEMEENFAAAAHNDDDDGRAMELQLWQRWRDTEPARLDTSAGIAGEAGSAARPIEIDDATDDATDSTTTMTPTGSEGRGGEPSIGGAEGGGGGGGGGVRLQEEETLWGHAVHMHELSPGDQIYVYRGAIQHHGIVTYVPQDHREAPASSSSSSSRPSGIQVVHFDSACDGVESTSLEDFLKGCTLRRATFSSSALSTGLDYGASYGCASDSPALIITRATEAAKFGEGASGWSGYSLLTNNCETFAYWCSTGRRQTLSRQATRGLVGAGIVAAGVSAVASAGGLASAGVAATAMVPRGVRGVQKGVQALEWATGVAVVAVAAADVVSTLVTRAPVPRNVNLQNSASARRRVGGGVGVNAISN